MLKKIQYNNDKTAVKEKNNVRCVVTLLEGKRDSQLIGGATCTIRLSKSTADNE